MLKQLIRTKIGLFCLSWIAAIIVAMLMLSVRWRTEDRDGFRRMLAAHDGVVLVFWHERILAMPWLWPRRHAMTALQSPHPDGRMLAHTVNHLGVRTVWGSSNRNALSGLRGMKRILDAGRIATVTPDGPRGPARIAAVGPVALAQMAGKTRGSGGLVGGPLLACPGVGRHDDPETAVARHICHRRSD